MHAQAHCWERSLTLLLSADCFLSFSMDVDHPADTVKAVDCASNSVTEGPADDAEVTTAAPILAPVNPGEPK